MLEQHITRDSLAMAIETLIAVLDAIDGDPGIELNGDEQDGNSSEDDWMHHGHRGPGCPISDPDSAVDDTYCDDRELAS